jgi:hypothetical protein
MAGSQLGSVNTGSKLRNIHDMITQGKNITPLIKNLNADVVPAIRNLMRVRSDHDPLRGWVWALFEFHRHTQRGQSILEVEACLVRCSWLQWLSRLSDNRGYITDMKQFCANLPCLTATLGEEGQRHSIYLGMTPTPRDGDLLCGAPKDHWLILAKPNSICASPELNQLRGHRS